MARLLAASLFVCAAFAWVPPFLDRAGVAALGAAFLAWSVGGPLWLARRTPYTLSPPFPIAEPGSTDALMSEWLAEYAAGNRS